LGWFLEYIPFWIMGRVTYLHHYFPALYFAIVCLTLTLDHLTTRFTPKFKNAILLIFGIAVIANYIYFIDFSFGMKGPASDYDGRRWLKSWKIHGDE
jgi:dolichyl-phosphate-mannose-protein mannosyltransferase